MSCFEASRKHPATSQREQSVFLLYARYNFYHQHKRRSRAARNHQSLISIETHKETATFVVKNAWKSVTRNKGRNMLIIVIVTIIAAAATIGLSIRQAAATARSSGLDNTTVTAQISLDRGKLIPESREQSKSDSDSSDASAKPDFDAMRSALADKQFSLADHQKYAKASSAVKSTYYMETTGLAATDDFQPVSGDFSLIGFSSDEAVANASNGSFTMVKGKVFGYDASSDGDAIISKSLADRS